MSLLAAFHTALGVLSLVTGAVVLARPKGTRWHRRMGWAYAVSMVVLCVASFGLRDTTPLFRGLGPFHIAAVVSLGTVLLGVWCVWRKPANWLEGHYASMAWSYIGLVMATGGHVARPIYLLVRDAGVPSGVALALAMGAVWGLPPLVGSRLIARRRGRWDALGPAASP